MTLKDPQRIPVKIVLLVGSTLTIMSGAIISPSLPTMLDHFYHLPNAEYLVRLVLTVPALFIALFSPFAGLIVDRFGRKRVLISGLLLYGIAGTSGVLLDSLYLILATRIFLGIAVAAVMTTITTLIADYYDGNTRARLMGLQAASIGFGGMVYLTVGGMLAEVAWNAPFLVYVIALFLLPLTVSAIFEPVVNDKQPDSKFRNNDGKVELKKAFPLMVALCACMFFMHVMFYIVPTQLPFHLRDLTGAGGVQIGIAIGSSTLFSAIASYMYGRISVRYTYVRVVIIALLLTGLGFFIVSFSSIYFHIIIGMLFSGVGVGLFMPNVTMWLSVVAPPSHRGRALGALTMSIFLGHFTSLLIIQPIITQIGFSATFLLSAATIVVVTGAITILSRMNFLNPDIHR